MATPPRRVKSRRAERPTLHYRQWGFRSWYLVGDAYACVPPKCGSTAFMRGVDPHERDGLRFRRRMLALKRGPFGPQDMIRREDGRARFLAVRDPVDRFRSLWRHITRSDAVRDWWTTRHRIPREIAAPAELLEYIRAFPMGNYHWYPQAGYLVPGVTLVRYTELLDRLGLPNAPHNVGREPTADDEVPEDEVRALYPLDVELWQKVCS